MDFISVQGGTVKDGKLGAAKAWLDENSAELRETAPDGSEFLGTYVSVYNSEKGAGDIFWLMRHDSYGALDNIAAAGGTRFGDLVGEWLTNFVDASSTVPQSSILLKSLTDATIWGE